MGARLSALLRPDLPHWWWRTVGILAAIYAAITLLIMIGSPLNTLDSYWYQLNLAPSTSPLHLPVAWAVFAGQRVPALIVAVAYVVHRMRRTHSTEPLVLLTLASAMFVATVGAVKYLTGRIGPRYTDEAHTVWDGGDIFPSGHVTGAVVMYGVIAILAPQIHRELLTTVAVITAFVVGFGTIALNTHWLSDVVGGWLNGALVLLIAWAITPAVHARMTRAARHWRTRRHLAIQKKRPAESPASRCRNDAASPDAASSGRDTPDIG